MEVRIELRRPAGLPPAYAVVDAEDVAFLSAWPWRLDSNGYAALTVRRGSSLTKLFLARMLMGCVPGDGLFVDHINRDRLDNRRANLRIVTPAESCQNKSSHAHSSRFRGVSLIRRSSRWRAEAQVDGRRYGIGVFATELEAAEAARAWRISHMPFSAEDIGRLSLDGDHLRGV